MGLFDCRGCKAKDSEIAHLMGQLDKLQAMVENGQKRLAELAEPGISLRLAGAARQEKRPETSGATAAALRHVRRMVPGFPDYGPEPKMGPHVEVDE